MMVIVKILDNGTVSFEGVGQQLFELLHQIKGIVECGDPDVENRLYPDPSGQAEDEEMREDWKSLVQPELQSTFQSARDTVAADLRRATIHSDGSRSFGIPPKHIDQWLGALNQARLALCELHHFTEKEMSRKIEHPQNDRDFILLQMNVYALIQEWLISLIE